MSGTYKAIGITLKSAAMGESDRLLTVLTPEFGLIRAVAPGSRKHQSSLRGRSGLFTINEMLIAKGKSLDKIVQVEGIGAFPGLSQDLRKLTAAQYLAELALSQALSEHPQQELFELLVEQLGRLEALPAAMSLAVLTHATYHLLSLAGIAPQVHACCLTQEEVTPDFSNPNWRIGFSAAAGGTVKLMSDRPILKADRSIGSDPHRVASAAATYQSNPRHSSEKAESIARLNATQVALLQLLPQPDLIQSDRPHLYLTNQAIEQPISEQVWISIERILRHYAQYHLDQPIRSAALIDTAFLAIPL